MTLAPDLALPVLVRAEFEDRLDSLTAEIASTADDRDLADALSCAVAGGGRVRPQLVLAAYDVMSGGRERTESVWSAALAYELLHAAFVVHDDVIDGDWERRGEPNPQALLRDAAVRAGSDPVGAEPHGLAGAIIVGDLLLHEATMLIGSIRGDGASSARVRSSYSRAVRVTAAGEWWDVIANPKTPGERVDQTVRDKTAAYTFAGPLVAGAALGGADDRECATIDHIGSLLGTAYQLCDDLIGAFGSREDAGRDEATDITAGRMTSIVSAARSTPLWPDISASLWGGPPCSVAEIRTLLELSGARSAVTDRMNALLAEAIHLTEIHVPQLRSVIDGVATRIQDRRPHD